MAQFISNLIQAYKTADTRDDFNIYDLIGASLVGLFLLVVFILGATIEAILA